MKQSDKILMYLQHNPEGLTTLEAMERLHITKISTRLGEIEPWVKKHISRTWETGKNEDGEITRYIRYRWVA